MGLGTTKFDIILERGESWGVALRQLLFWVFGWFLWGFGMCVCVWPLPVPGFPLMLLGFVLARGLFGLLKPVWTMLPMGVSLFDFTFYPGISSQYQCVECFCSRYKAVISFAGCINTSAGHD